MSNNQGKQTSSGTGVVLLFFGILALLPLSFAVGWFDTATELLPAHDSVDQFCMVFAIACGVLAGAAAIYLTRSLKWVQRIMLPLVILFEAVIGTFLVTSHITNIVEGYLDFPAGSTHTRQALFFINRAYQTHGKGASQYIQTTPIWSNLEITKEDFAFMQSHRRPGDDGHNPDEISSRGYFCARVTIQESGHALRILHAGSQKLPSGTVLVCPALVPRPPLPGSTATPAGR